MDPKMKSEINRMTKELGIPPLKFTGDSDLRAYSQGLPLTLGNLRVLPEGAVVWVWYKEHGEEGPRINRAMRIAKTEDPNYWDLEDGSSFGASFRPTGEYIGPGFAVPPDTAKCRDEGSEGDLYLHHAVPKTQPKMYRGTRSNVLLEHAIPDAIPDPKPGDYWLHRKSLRRILIDVVEYGRVEARVPNGRRTSLQIETLKQRYIRER